MSKIRGFMKGWQGSRESNSQDRARSIDALTQRAALDEAGYETPDALFGGQTLKRAESFGNVPSGFVRVGGKVVQDPTYTKPSTDVDNARADYYRSRTGFGQQTLTPARQAVKDKKITELFGQFETNKVKRGMIDDAEKALPNVPQGFGGKLRVMGAKMFNPNDPILGDWQKLKSVLTDAQLMNTAKTKGAISDQEMKLFAQAAANDDLVSLERVRPIIAKLKGFLEADENAAVGSFKRVYNEDPMEWPEMQQFGGGARGGANLPRFNTPEEAEASGYKGEAIVGGRKARIE